MIYVTEKAKKYLSDILKEKKAIGIEVLVKNTGCSGKSYYLNYVYSIEYSNIHDVYSSNGLKIKVKKDDINYFKNISIDLLTEKFSSKIIFKNPDAHGVCGCGESFKFKLNK